jgi:hypothetical protein
MSVELKFVLLRFDAGLGMSVPSSGWGRRLLRAERARLVEGAEEDKSGKRNRTALRCSRVFTLHTESMLQSCDITTLLVRNMVGPDCESSDFEAFDREQITSKEQFLSRAHLKVQRKMKALIRVDNPIGTHLK